MVPLFDLSSDIRLPFSPYDSHTKSVIDRVVAKNAPGGGSVRAVAQVAPTLNLADSRAQLPAIDVLGTLL